MHDDDRLMSIAGLTRDAVSMSEALLEGDLTEARFRAHLVAAHADTAGMADVALAAARVVALLGPASARPSPGYGQAIAALSVALERAQEG